ncbi:MAG: spore germination protein [Thermacetogeniaceae bacterium]|jgi:spore germination protein KA|nr:spore germination protein [Syntrophomonadaceae bacterium]
MRPLKKPKKSAEIRKQRINARLEQIQPDTELLKQPISPVLDHNVELFKKMFAETSDFVVRQFHFGSNREIRVALIFIDGLVDRTSISESIFTPFMMKTLENGEQEIVPQNPYDLILNWLVTFYSVKEEVEIGKLLDLLLAGFAILFIDGAAKALAIEVKGWAMRSVEEPKAESFVRGPREGFTETLRVNTALIRRRIRTPKLRFDMLQIGSVTKTDVCVAYIDGLVNPATVKEVKQRLERIDTDSILESGYLEDFIRDNYRTPFALLDRTERPDKVAGCLVEGRVAIMVDNTPFVLIVPAVFSGFLQSPEDYYEAHDYIRPLRWVALFLTLTLPSFYVALTTFHQEMIPGSLALSMAVGRAGVPFPAVVEALLMEITFDLLREAGTRMPRSVGQAVGVVGALVLGQAAVAAGIVSPFMVIIVALTAIASFLIPNYSASIAIRYLRYPILLLAGSFGLLGVFWGLMLLLLHLASLRSFGVPYLYPISPAVPGEWQDVFYRAPWWAMDRRPRLFRSPNIIRQAPGQRPEPPENQSQAQRNSGAQEQDKQQHDQTGKGQG